MSAVVAATTAKSDPLRWQDQVYDLLRRHDVTLFHVLDHAELEFPFEDPTLFLSMEDERQVEANGRDMRKGYLEVFRRWLAEVRRAALEADVDYGVCRTDTPLEKVLLPFLARRERTAA